MSSLQSDRPTMPEASIKEMVILIGELPLGDVPKAWWVSTHADVLAGYDKYKADHAAWQTQYKSLTKLLDLPSDTAYVTHSKDIFAGLVLPKNANVPRWMRVDKNGVLVPRKRTLAEKESDASLLFDKLVDIPVAINLLPGMDEIVITDNRLYPIQVRKPGKAVLAFAGIAPEDADEPFHVGPEWSRMKLSTYHLLRERQEQK